MCRFVFCPHCLDIIGFHFLCITQVAVLAILDTLYWQMIRELEYGLRSQSLSLMGFPLIHVTDKPSQPIATFLRHSQTQSR